MSAARPLPKPIAGQITNPGGFWYRVHGKCRRVPILKAGAGRDRQERRA